MPADPPPKLTFDEKVNEQITQGSTTHWNLAQEVIITNEDKLRLCILKHIDSLTVRASWVAPVSLFVTFATVLTTAKFRLFVLPAATWRAVFVLGTVLTFLWSVYAVRRAYGAKADIDTLVGDIKLIAKRDGE